MGVASDDELLRDLHEFTEMRRELDDPSIPFYFNEWGGLNRQMAAEECHQRVLALVEECSRRGLDWYEAYWGEPRKEQTA
jgi:agmatine/peptidylarginine deiminase